MYSWFYVYQKNVPLYECRMVRTLNIQLRFRRMTVDEFFTRRYFGSHKHLRYFGSHAGIFDFYEL